MNWSRVKSVMIVLLICVNVYFIYTLAVMYRSAYLISDKMKEDTAALLGADGIVINAGIIPGKKVSAEIYEGFFGEDYYKNVVAAISGTDNYSWHMINNGIKCILRESGDVFEFYDNNLFGIKYIKNGNGAAGSYVDGDYASNAVSAAKTASASGDKYYAGAPVGTSDTGTGIAESTGDTGDTGTTGVAVSLTPVKNSELKKLRKLINNFLQLDANSSGVQIAETVLNVGAAYRDAATGRFVVLCSQSLDGYSVGQCDVAFITDGSGVLYAEGTLIFMMSHNKYPAVLYDQINILFIEKAYIDGERERHIASGSGAGGYTGEYGIERISCEYCVNWNSDRSAFYLIPAWRIEYADGSAVIRNAVNGSIYTS